MSKERNAGLDLIRSIAILLVLLVHSSNLLGPYISISSYLKFPDGVDVFFVLSGFLVGRLLINSYLKHGKWTGWIALDFMQRRWFRTLPNYYLFLIINIAFTYFSYTGGMLNGNAIAYFFFLQNFHVPLDLFFWESWSLAIEEWFYLLFPLATLLIFSLKLGSPKTNLALGLIIFILVPLLIRNYLNISMADINNETWDLYFRKLVITRLDCLAIGMLGAFWYIFHPKNWERLAYIKFLIGIVALVYLTVTKADKATPLYSIWYFSANAFAILLTFPLIMRLPAENRKYKPLKFISNASYTAYLIHLPLMYLFIRFFPINDDLTTVIRYFTYILTVFGGSHLIFTYFEEPFKNIREKVSMKIAQKHNN